MSTDTGEVRELHRELVDEFFFYADKKNWHDMLADSFYWSTRGTGFVACAANLPGTKFLIATDDPAELSELVPKAFMLHDHVLIRHRKLCGVSGIQGVSVPDDFASFEPLSWFEKRRARGETAGLPTLPHFRNVAPEGQLRGFVDWMCGPGRDWLRNGRVSYVPNLPSQEVETGLLLEGCNLQSRLAEANVFPQATALLDEKAASAFGRLDIPYLSGADAETLIRFKEEEREAVERFQYELLTALNDIKGEQNSPEFSKAVERIFLELREKVRDAERAIELQAKNSTWGRQKVELIMLTGVFLFWIGAPLAASIGTLGLAAASLVQELRESLKERYSLRQNPMYALARLGERVA